MLFDVWRELSFSDAIAGYEKRKIAKRATRANPGEQDFSTQGVHINREKEEAKQTR